MPSNSKFYITVLFAQFQIRELAFLLLPVVNLFCWSNNRVWVADRKLKTLIACFLIIIISTEVFKHLYYVEGLGNAFKTIRKGFPLFTILLLVYTGIRSDIEKVWQTLLWAISTSAVLTLISPFINLPIYPYLEGENILESSQGRLMNSNSSFGIIGIYILYKEKYRWYIKGWLPKLASLLSITTLILSYNRTYLVLLALGFMYLSFTEFSFRKAFTIISIPVVAFGIFWAAYNYSEAIHKQVDSRIFGVIAGTTLLSESVYENNRDAIFKGVSDRIKEGYWLFGLSYNRPIFTWYRKSLYQDMTNTDTSFITILLRYGLLPLVIYCSILYNIYKKDFSGIFSFSLLVFIIASLNIDSLLMHNSVYFLFILLFVSYEKGLTQGNTVIPKIYKG